MLEAFLTFINEKALVPKASKVLLAVSGGIDSMVLADLFQKADIQFAIAHCNFQLRGKEADEDEKFVMEYAQTHQIECFTTQFETKKYAQQNKVSTQMAARNLRYAWFDVLMQEHHFAFLATAHHANDNIETLLLNLVKGTGIAGIRGIETKKEHLIRPLLFASRTMIENYAQENAILWREDISNQSDDYQRNLLRNRVVPVLKEINPSLENTFLRNFQRFEELNLLLQNALDAFKKQYVLIENERILISIEGLIQQPFLLEELLKPYHFNFQQVQQIKEKMLLGAGKVFDSSSHQLFIDRQHVIIKPISTKSVAEKYIIQANDLFIHTPVFSLRFEKFAIEKLDKSLFKNQNIALFDFDKISFPLELRNWQQGDWFIPFGMKGKKKISDFLVDIKTPLDIKKNIFLLFSNQEVLWLIGKRTDERFKIDMTTSKILKIDILYLNN